MKTRLIYLILMMGTAAGYASAADYRQVVSIVNLTEEQINSLSYSSDSPYIVEVPEGTCLPIHFFLNGDLLELHAEDDHSPMIVAKRDFYAFKDECGWMLSPDASTWCPLCDFVTGQLNVGLQIKDARPHLQIGATVNRR